MTASRHIFFKPGSKRWKYISALTKVVFVLVGLFVFVFVYSVVEEPYRPLPRISGLYDYTPLPNLEELKPQDKKSSEFLEKRKQIQRYRYKGHLQKNKNNTVFKPDSINSPGHEYHYSSFYVNWDPRSFFSLKKNVNKLGSVFCEWIFLDMYREEADYYPDERAISLLTANGIKIIPMISNFVNGAWQSGRLSEILSNEKSRRTFISSVQKVIDENHFDGINVDFESVQKRDQYNLLLFQKELYAKLHKTGFEVSMDLPVGNNDFKYSELSNYNDRIVLMTYDEHDAESIAGPIASLDWFHSSIEGQVSLIPPQKIIVGLGAYGYDWPKMDVGHDLTFQESISTSAESEAIIKFDSLSSNPYFQYYDDNDFQHDVWFLDAVSMYNQMQSIRNTESTNKVNGFAFWRLGSEDPSIWSFYELPDKDIQNRISDLVTAIPVSSDIDFEGEGEILDVVSTPGEGMRSVKVNSRTGLISSETYNKLPSSYLIRKFGSPASKNSGLDSSKKMVLTFDDGPDEKYTPQILDILKKKNVKADFFIVGINAEDNIDLLKRIYDEGHELGSHTFFHPNIAEISKERTELELTTTQRLLESVLGHSTIMFRPPYVADSEPQTAEEIVPIVRAKELGYLTIGESIDPLDWEVPPANVIIKRVLEQKELGSIILLHDAGGDRNETVKALPQLIDTLKSMGYKFVTVGDLIGKSRDELMPKVPDSEMYFTNTNKLFLESLYFLKNLAVALFYIAIVLGIIRLIFVLVSAIVDMKKYEKRNFLKTEKYSVSVIIPAYNEEKVISNSVNSILKSDYNNFELIVIDDGSSDKTFDLVKNISLGLSYVRVYKISNSGKAAALNFGLKVSKGEIIITLDADTVFKPDTISMLLRNFSDEDIAAVAGNVKVGNRHNILTRWQSLEYITSQNLDRRAFDFWNGIIVVPGAVGAFRKEVIKEAGGFPRETLAEDTDLTMQIVRNGYRVINEPAAIGYTEAPEKIIPLFRQRYRWVYGTFQSFWKHRSVFLNPKNKGLGFVSFPNILIFQLLIPLVAPLVDILFILSILSGYFSNILLYYFLFLFIDTLVSFIAIRLEKESFRLLFYLPLQRLLYRQILYVAVVKSVITAIKGGLVSWRKLERSGKAKVVFSNK